MVAADFDRQARSLAEAIYAEVKVRARAILKKHKSLGAFVLLEGAWWFTARKDDRILDESEARFKPVAELMTPWGRGLGAACPRVTFTAEGPEESVPLCPTR